MEQKKLFTPRTILHLNKVYDHLELFVLDEEIIEPLASELMVVYHKYFRTRYDDANDLNIYFDVLNIVMNKDLYWKHPLSNLDRIAALKVLFEYLASSYDVSDPEKRTKCIYILIALTKAHTILASSLYPEPVN